MQFAAEAMRSLNDYVDGRTGNGKTTTMCVDMAVDVLATAHHAKWSIADSSLVLLQLQAELDADGPAAALAHSRRVTAMIGLGYTADQILDGRRQEPGYMLPAAPPPPPGADALRAGQRAKPVSPSTEK